MKRLITSMLAGAMTMFGLTQAPSFAQGHGIHDIHQSTHFAHPVHNGLQPYICDVDGDIADGDFTAQYVKDGARIPLQVANFFFEDEFFCDNAGGFIVLPHSVRFNSMSAQVKRTGNVTRDELFFAFFIDGDPLPWFFSLGDSIEGSTTADGYTLYTLTPGQAHLVDPVFPLVAFINEYGWESDLVNVGTANFDQFRLNGALTPKFTPVFIGCVFSDPADCRVE